MYELYIAFKKKNYLYKKLYYYSLYIESVHSYTFYESRMNTWIEGDADKRNETEGNGG